MTEIIIGVLAIQGSFSEHIERLKSLGVQTRQIRNLNDTNQISALILPGGESTTLIKLLQKTGLDKYLIEQAKKGMPIYGTCAGMIILSNLKLIDIEIERNAYGSQSFSFETEIDFLGKNFNGIFIRAPRIKKLGKSVKILAKKDNEAVLVEENNILAGSFHPELTNNNQIHKYFLEKIQN